MHISSGNPGYVPRGMAMKQGIKIHWRGNLLELGLEKGEKGSDDYVGEEVSLRDL